MGHYPNTALFNPPKKSGAGEWPKLFRENNSGVPYRVQPAQHPQYMVTQKVCWCPSSVDGVCEDILPDSLPPHISAPSCRRPSAKRRHLGGLRRTKPMSRRTLLEARRRARQSIREYEFDLVAAAALACSVLASLALALHAATAQPRHGVVRP